MGLNLALPTVTGLHHWVYLKLAPWLCTDTPLAQPLSLASTAVHIPMRTFCNIGMHADSQGPHSCQHAPMWPKPLLLALAPTTMCVSATGPCHTQTSAAGPCSQVCICHHIWPPHCLPWVFSCQTESCCWRPQQPMPPLKTSHSACRGPHSCQFCEFQWPELMRHHALLDPKPSHASILSPLHHYTYGHRCSR